MIKVVRIQVTMEQFRALPKDERALLLLMGHALNQIAVLVKLVTFSTNKDPADQIESRVSPANFPIISHTPTKLSRALKPSLMKMMSCPGNGICQRQTPTAFIFHAKWLLVLAPSAKYKVSLA
jgi:hypothetical protein